MTELTLTPHHVTTLRDQLIQPDDCERFAYLYCTEDNGRLVPVACHILDDDELAVSEPTACRPRPQVERQHLEHCVHHDLIPLLVHSHPFSAEPRFSNRDHTMMDQHHSWVTGLYPDQTVGFGVIGTEGIHATLYQPDGTTASLPTAVIGNWKLEPPVPTGDTFTIPTTVDTDRYDRNIRVFTAEGQQDLANACVGVVGVGGLGSIVAEQLARLGIGSLVLIDPDTVERSNLSRLVGATEGDTDAYKVDVVNHHVFEANPDVEVTAVATAVEDTPTALHDVDVVLGCVDQVGTRVFLNEYSVKHLVPYLDAGSRIETDDGAVTTIEGYLQTVVPGGTACFDCLDRWDPATIRREQLSDTELKAEIERGYIDADALTPEPAVVYLNGVIASLMVSSVTKLLTGYAEPPDFLRYDGLTNDVTEISTTPMDNCITCSSMLGRTHRYPAPDTAPPGTGHVEVDLSW